MNRIFNGLFFKGNPYCTVVHWLGRPNDITRGLFAIMSGRTFLYGLLALLLLLLLLTMMTRMIITIQGSKGPLILNRISVTVDRVFPYYTMVPLGEKNWLYSCSYLYQKVLVPFKCAPCLLFCTFDDQRRNKICLYQEVSCKLPTSRGILTFVFHCRNHSKQLSLATIRFYVL